MLKVCTREPAEMEQQADNELAISDSEWSLVYKPPESRLSGWSLVPSKWRGLTACTGVSYTNPLA